MYEGDTLPQGSELIGKVRFNAALPKTESAPQEPHQCVSADTQPSKFLDRCYHKCRSIFSWQFFVGLTISFPFEHLLWTRVPGFSHIGAWLGLVAH